MTSVIVISLAVPLLPLLETGPLTHCLIAFVRLTSKQTPVQYTGIIVNRGHCAALCCNYHESDRFVGRLIFGVPANADVFARIVIRNIIAFTATAVLFREKRAYMSVVPVNEGMDGFY